MTTITTGLCDSTDALEWNESIRWQKEKMC